MSRTLFPNFVPILVLFAIIILITDSRSDGHGGHLTFGSYCGSSNSIGQPAQCNFKALLECNIHGICRCVEPRIMTYESSSSTCVVLAGESCLPSPKLWNLDNITKFQRDDYFFPCVKNSFCNLENHTCQCTSGFFQSAERTCKPKLHGSNCKIDTDCGSGETHLICTPQKKCGCNTKLSIFYSSHLCRGITGAPCDTSGKLCGPNAECVGEFQNTRECVCNQGFSKSSDGRCLIAYSNECSMEKVCNEEEENTICVESRCVCKSGQTWDDSQKKCKQQLYARCNNTLDCAEEMHCLGKTCVCNEGLFPVDYGCHPSFGQACDYKPLDTADTRKPGRICNPLAFSLQCVKGVCQCKNIEFFDKELHKCRGLVDAFCDLQLDNGKYCTSNAECVRPLNYRVAEKGMCKCKDGFKVSLMQHCIEK